MLVKDKTKHKALWLELNIFLRWDSKMFCDFTENYEQKQMEKVVIGKSDKTFHFEVFM